MFLVIGDMRMEVIKFSFLTPDGNLTIYTALGGYLYEKIFLLLGRHQSDLPKFSSLFKTIQLQNHAVG